jgi:hypothetical protein
VSADPNTFILAAGVIAGIAYSVHAGLRNDNEQEQENGPERNT